MIYFDRPYSECTLSYPATVRDIVQDACRHCQVDCESSSIEMGNYIVKTKPEGSITYRDVISYCAQIMGCYARINHLGRLAFGWYDFSAVGSGDLDGGIFDTASQEKYLSGDEADGGTFDDYSSGYTYDGGTFVDMDTYHHFYDLYNKSINGTDINVTGIQITAKKDSADEKYLYGTNTYALEIKDNPLIQTDTMQQVAKHIGDKIINKPFRPMSISVQGNPAIEAGDVAVVSPKTTSSYTTVITDTTFSLFAAQSISSTAETPTAKTFTRYGAATKLLEAARNYTDQEMSAYDLVVQQMSQLAANTLGFHETKIIQDDGSVIVYRHDKPKLSESKIVYKSGIDGFFVTKNYTGKDSTTVWKAGFDSNGNAALNILSVIGIHWDWAYGGTLSLGGVGNGNGVLKVFDAKGNVVGLWDKDGLIAKAGKFSGDITGATGKFSGDITGASGTFSGRLDSQTGNIAGWDISSEGLSAAKMKIYSNKSINDEDPFGDIENDYTKIYKDAVLTDQISVNEVNFTPKRGSTYYKDATRTVTVVTDVSGSTVNYTKLTFVDGILVNKLS